jgi:hypothetical protein
MSIFGSLAKLAGGIAKNPLVKMGAGLVPGLGTALSVADLGFSAYGALKGPSSSGPASGFGGGLPALPGMGGGPMGVAASMPVPYQGNLKTVHTSAMFPQDKASLDAWIAAGLLVPFNKLSVAHRAPRGYRVVHVNGITMGVRSDVARKMHLVPPTHKPPISVGQWHALKKAGHTIKIMDKVEKEVRKIARHATKGHHRAHPANIIIARRKK